MENIGSSFSTFDVDQSNVAIQYENGEKQNVECSHENRGAWWYGKKSTSCVAKTNFNAFNFENLMYIGKQAKVTQLTVARGYEDYYTHRMLF